MASRSDLRNEYWLPGQGIHRNVLQAEITRHLGGDATCKPATSQDGQRGFVITAIRDFTRAQLDDIRALSASYENENYRRTRGGENQTAAVPYASSSTHQSSQRRWTDQGFGNPQPGGEFGQPTTYASAQDYGQQPSYPPTGGYSQQPSYNPSSRQNDPSSGNTYYTSGQPNYTPSRQNYPTAPSNSGNYTTFGGRESYQRSDRTDYPAQPYNGGFGGQDPRTDYPERPPNPPYTGASGRPNPPNSGSNPNPYPGYRVDPRTGQWVRE